MFNFTHIQNETFIRHPHVDAKHITAWMSLGPRCEDNSAHTHTHGVYSYEVQGRHQEHEAKERKRPQELRAMTPQCRDTERRGILAKTGV